MTSRLCFRLFFKFLFLIVTTYCVTNSIANSSTIQVSGIVSDNLYNPVTSARVIFVSGGNDTTDAITDTNGYYSLSLPKPSHISDTIDIPQIFSLYQNYPNPFNPSTIIEYKITYASLVRLNIYNCVGQLVRKLVNGEENPGKHSIAWNGMDEYGRHLAAGVYLYCLEAGGHSLTRKMLLLDGGAGTGFGLRNSNSVAKAYKSSASEETIFEIVLLKDGYESYREEVVTIPLTANEFRKDIVVHKNLPKWITDNDMKELVRQTFVMAVIDHWISDTSLFRYEISTLSRKNIDPLWVPSIPEIPLILHTPLEIHAIADSTQDYMYFSMPYAPEFSDSSVVISLDYFWAVGKNSPYSYLSGGGFKVKFSRNNDQWDRLVFDRWIS